MKPSSLAAVLLGALLVAGPVRSEGEAAPPEVALKRVNLLVRDMQRAQARLRFCTLDSSTEVRALALTEVTGIELPPQPPINLSTPVIRVARFDDVHAKLRAAGLNVVEPRRSRTSEGRDFRELAFTDPDGHLVVLYQLD